MVLEGAFGSRLLLSYVSLQPARDPQPYTNYSISLLQGHLVFVTSSWRGSDEYEYRQYSCNILITIVVIYYRIILMVVRSSSTSQTQELAQATSWCPK